jgi:hypothetical protein
VEDMIEDGEKNELNLNEEILPKIKEVLTYRVQDFLKIYNEKYKK